MNITIQPVNPNSVTRRRTGARIGSMLLFLFHLRLGCRRGCGRGAGPVRGLRSPGCGGGGLIVGAVHGAVGTAGERVWQRHGPRRSRCLRGAAGKEWRRVYVLGNSSTTAIIRCAGRKSRAAIRSRVELRDRSGHWRRRCGTSLRAARGSRARPACRTSGHQQSRNNQAQQR